jgi:amino acid transporter
MNSLLKAIKNPPKVPGLTSVSPLAGLARRQLGAVDALAQAMAAAAPTAGVATLPALLAAGAGSGTAAAVCLATLLVVLISSSISQYARRLAVAGSLYSYAAQVAKPYLAFLTGAALLTGYGFIAMFALTGASIYGANLAGRIVHSEQTLGLPVAVGIVLIAAVCFVILRRGVRISSRTTLALECGSVLLVLTLVTVLLVRQGLPDWSTVDPLRVSTGKLAAGTVLALTAFVGFESSTALGVETRKPLKTIPRTMMWTVLITGLVYLFGTYAQLSGFAALGLDLGSSEEPLVELARSRDLFSLIPALDLAICLSFVACTLASATALVRLLFTMGREGVLPAWLGRAHPRFQTPFRAIEVALPVIILPPLILMALGFAPWSVMRIVVTCGASAFVSAYIAVCAAVPFFLKRIGESTLRPIVQAITAAALLSAALVIYLAESLGESNAALGVGMFSGIALAASLLFFVRRGTNPALLRDHGIYDEPTKRDVLQ